MKHIPSTSLASHTKGRPSSVASNHTHHISHHNQTTTPSRIQTSKPIFSKIEARSAACPSSPRTLKTSHTVLPEQKGIQNPITRVAMNRPTTATPSSLTSSQMTLPSPSLIEATQSDVDEWCKKKIGIMTAMTQLEHMTRGLDLTKLKPLEMATIEEERAQSATFKRLDLAEKFYLRTLDDFEAHEEKRARAHMACVMKPLRDKTDKRSLSWLQALACVRPAKIFRELYLQHRAKKILRHMFLAIYLRYIHVKRLRKRRKEYTLARQTHMHPPTFEHLRMNALFEKLPDETLKVMIDGMEPGCFRAGEVIAHEGDWGAEMWFLDNGVVETRVRVMTGKLKQKSRGEKNTTLVNLQNTRGASFGEFALLAREPRVATLVCTQDTDTWILRRHVFDVALAKLPPATVDALRRKADERRMLIMSKLYGLNETSLRNSCKFIDGWSSKGVQKILKRLQPRIFRKGEYLFREGEQADGIYILVGGRAEMWKEGTGRQALLTPTSAFGEVGTVISNKRTSSVRALSQCDVWFVAKPDVMDALGHESLLCISPLLEASCDFVSIQKVKDGHHGSAGGGEGEGHSDSASSGPT